MGNQFEISKLGYRRNDGTALHPSILQIPSTIRVNARKERHAKSLLLYTIRFDPLRIVISLTTFKTRLLGRGFHTKECFIPLSNRYGISQSTPLGAQRPH